jgi:hypothetical protein
MTPDEKEKLWVELCQRWPNRFTDSDLHYGSANLDGYAIDAVVAALTEFKNNSRFVPKLGEIVKLLPAPPRPSPTGAAVNATDMTFPQMLRRDNPKLIGCGDFEVLLRYWRGQWIHYHVDADKRRAQIPTTPGPGRVAGELFERQYDGAKRRVVSGCVNGLIGAGMDIDQAERAAAFIFEHPDTFRLALQDMRMPVEEPVEVFDGQ